MMKSKGKFKNTLKQMTMKTEPYKIYAIQQKQLLEGSLYRGWGWSGEANWWGTYERWKGDDRWIHHPSSSVPGEFPGTVGLHSRTREIWHEPVTRCIFLWNCGHLTKYHFLFFLLPFLPGFPFPSLLLPEYCSSQ